MCKGIFKKANWSLIVGVHLLVGTSAWGATATFTPIGPTTVEQGTNVVFDVIVSVSGLAGFDTADVVIGSAAATDISFAYSAAWSAGFANVTPPVFDTGLYAQDVFVGGNSSASVGTSVFLGTVTVNTTGLGAGSYSVLIQNSFDGISTLGLAGVPEPLDGTGAFTISSQAGAPPALLPEPGGSELERFLAFVVPLEGAGSETALRVTLDSLYHPGAPLPVNPPDLSAHQGEPRYVNLLRDAGGNPVTSCLSSAAFSTFYRCAGIGCTPEYLDWATLFGGEVVHASGASIVPDSTFTMAQLAATCVGNEAACAAASAGLGFSTARHGDADSTGIVNVSDVVTAVDVVKGVFGAAWEYECYVRRQDPAPHLDAANVTDIVLHVDAVKLVAYALPVPSCP